MPPTQTSDTNAAPIAIERAAVRLRRDLHKHPDLSEDEADTARRVHAFLKEHAGLEPVADDIGGHGLLYRLDLRAGTSGNDPSSPTPAHSDAKPTPANVDQDATRANRLRIVLLRAELDALPLTESTGPQHRSIRDGHHHACGHDGHMAMLAGALVQLATNDTGSPGNPDTSTEGADPTDTIVYALFQPAEETGMGAARCLDHPAISNIKPAEAYAIHNVPGVPEGQIAVRPGPMASASVGLKVAFGGATAHAASPHEGRNPVPALAQLALRAAALPSESLAFGTAALVTPIELRAGQRAYGTAAGAGHLRLTVRAATDDALHTLLEAIHREANGLATLHDLSLQIDEHEPFPGTDNHTSVVEHVRRSASALGLSVTQPPGPFPWSEDFGHFTARYPGALIALGSGESQSPLHTPEYDFPDALVPTGIALWCQIVREEPR